MTMAKPPIVHLYSDRASFDRLMLLISAIANNPGIAPSGIEDSPIAALLKEMQAIALASGIFWQEWSEPTIRKDLALLRKYSILPSTTIRGGYYLGQAMPVLPPVIRKPRKNPKSKMSPQEIVRLRGEGRSLAEIAALAGISRERVRQIEQEQRNKSG